MIFALYLVTIVFGSFFIILSTNLLVFSHLFTALYSTTIIIPSFFFIIIFTYVRMSTHFKAKIVRKESYDNCLVLSNGFHTTHLPES